MHRDSRCRRGKALPRSIRVRPPKASHQHPLPMASETPSENNTKPAQSPYTVRDSKTSVIFRALSFRWLVHATLDDQPRVPLLLSEGLPLTFLHSSLSRLMI
jgi:hypothetical protein